MRYALVIALFCTACAASQPCPVAPVRMGAKPPVSPPGRSAALGASAPADKVLTLGSKSAADDLKAAVFKQYRADQLALRRTIELDIDRNGRVLVPQVTTQYTAAPPPVFADALRPTAQELSDYAASSQVTVAVDATVEAMQGRVVDIGGKSVTIDVSAATAPAAQAGASK